MRTLQVALAVSLSFIAAACGDDQGGSPADASLADAAGSPFRLEGTATATDGADRVDCSFAIEMAEPIVTGDGWTAASFGEVFRRSFLDDDPVFEFSALVGGDASLTADGGAVQLRAVGDQPDDAAPFWLALEVLAGTETGELAYEGSWTCSPILPDSDAEDSDLNAVGTWNFGPVR